jgi:hypothetical protein
MKSLKLFVTVSLVCFGLLGFHSISAAQETVKDIPKKIENGKAGKDLKAVTKDPSAGFVGTRPANSGKQSSVSAPPQSGKPATMKEKESQAIKTYSDQKKAEDKALSIKIKPRKEPPVPGAQKPQTTSPVKSPAQTQPAQKSPPPATSKPVTGSSPSYNVKPSTASSGGTSPSYRPPSTNTPPPAATRPVNSAPPPSAPASSSSSSSSKPSSSSSSSSTSAPKK